MISTQLQKNNFDLLNDLKYISALVSEQRLTKNKNIEKMYKDYKKNLHIAEYNLLVGLFKSLQKSFMIEYFDYLNSEGDTYLLFDVWGMDKLLRIYHNVSS
jgi:hypothetical protein